MRNHPFLSNTADLPQRVLKAVVGSTRVDKVAGPKLLEVAQSLELRGVNDGHTQGVEFYVAMHWVIEHLKNSATHWSVKLTKYAILELCTDFQWKADEWDRWEKEDYRHAKNNR